MNGAERKTDHFLMKITPSDKKKLAICAEKRGFWSMSQYLLWLLHNDQKEIEKEERKRK